MIKRLYIAYGSNLNMDQMAFRCPDARPLGKSILEGYKLKFKGSGVATIEPCEGSNVQVGIWSISAEDEASLDVYEGFPRLYIKEYLPFVLDGEKMSGLAYVMQGDRIERYPYWHYEETIRQGYIDFGLDIRRFEEALDECWESVRKGGSK